MNTNNNDDQAIVLNSSSRRTFFQQTTNAVCTIVGTTSSIVGVSSSSLVFVQPAYAIPMVTSNEFNILIRDSARSVQVVEFSGPKSENVIVKLADGTIFGIKDIIESSTDPRSPLKIAAVCRENKVPTKFVDLEAALAKTGGKKTVYTNARVQEAQIKEKEKLARIQQDEENRLAELARMEKEGLL